jgi:asparagine synthase (glutamine-hydrolysing)
MCGIAGLVHFDGRAADRATLVAMTRVLAHRGPDGEGFHVDGPVGLGHRRLSIIDLAAGGQPMASDDRRVWITYNGEVYNYRELRSELTAHGCRFSTASDTEVVLRGYETWGVDVLQRLRGMFAFAIWDGRRRQILLARDRVGIKPLVYGWDGRTLRFGSEPKALLQDREVRRDLDREALRDYFVHLFVPAPRTIFRAVRKLPPASYLVGSLDTGRVEVHRYWRLGLSPDYSVSEAEWVERLRALLAETVRLHMVADVPLGAFLSGGVDSSTVVAFMARASATPVKTFSIGFDEADFDELAYARLVARRHGTDHYEMIVKPDVVEVLPRLAWQLDEPFADASVVPTYCVSRITRDHVTVALSGDGGDEAFAGYRRYLRALRLSRRVDLSPLALVKPLARFAAACLPEGTRGKGLLALLGATPLTRYFSLMTFQRAATLRRLLTADALAGVEPDPDLEAYRRLAAAAGARDYLSVLQYIDTHHYLPEDILTKVDRTSMLASLESRVPLLDHVLLEFAATIPPELKVRAGAGKYILKQAMVPDLPSEVLERPKMGFGVPLARWFRGELREWATGLLTDPRARQRGLVRPEAVATLLDEHRRGRRDWSPQLWSLVCFELWCRTWWDR